uniref:Lipocalin n=1 Tax=Rhipicephalus appendiculatus TaxID=34631 RepID=A0A131YSK8_RHIAP
MKFIALFLVFGVALRQQNAVDAKPDWADETRFGPYQNPWQSKPKQRYYLAKGTKENDSVWGNNFTCVSVTGEPIPGSEQKLNATVQYKNAKHTLLQTTHETVSPTKLYNYTETYNGIQYETQGQPTQTFCDAFVLSDPGNCDIIFDPDSKGSDTGDYELWVGEDKVENIPICCQFLTTYLAQLAGKSVRKVYTDQTCKPQVSTARK